MKKILSILMILCLGFILVGCDDEGPIPYKYDSYEASEKIRELGNSTGFLIEYTMDYGQDSYRGIKNNNQHNLYDDFEDWDEDDYDDYDYDYDDDDYGLSTITIGIKNNITYVSMGMAELYIDFSDSSKVVLYLGVINEATGAYKWEKEEMAMSEFYSNDYYYTYSQIYSELTPSEIFNQGAVMKKKTDVVCGRLCDKLTLADSRSYSSDSDTVDVYIDKEYGFCLKMITNTTEKGKTISTGMECTRFEINPAIALPNV